MLRELEVVVARICHRTQVGMGDGLCESDKLFLRNNPIEIWYASLQKRPPQPTAVFTSAQTVLGADSGMHHCRSVRLGCCISPCPLGAVSAPLSAAVTTDGHVRKLESSGGFSMKRRPAPVEGETSQLTYFRESNSTPSDVQQVSREDVKNDERVEKANEAGPTNSVDPSTIPASFISLSWLTGEINW